MKTPCIIANLAKIKENARYILAACEKSGVTLAAVTKVVCAHEPIVEALIEAGVLMLADARAQNLARLPRTLPRLSLRPSDPMMADETIENSEYSLQSEVKTISALGLAARGLEKQHGVILLIDLGDLREGLYHRDREGIMDLARAVSREPWLKMEGVGTNLTCFGGILPDDHNLGALIEIAQTLRRELNLPIPIVSGGNSSSLHLLFEGRLPAGINHLRVGEGLLLGRDTAHGRPFPFLHQDAFTLAASLVEVQDKPSKPEGTSGPNAFGEYVEFPDLGPMRRGILAIGRQDTDAEGLHPKDERVKILGASSDHLIVDLSRAPEYQVGDALAFTPDYGALLKAYTSPYVYREREEDEWTRFWWWRWAATPFSEKEERPPLQSS
ncbi:MAG: alanine/ornithine racemase family PLP-dependent enzyme [Eubacteriales bacterium]|nr:alanine/ornithine racemase family PLP-dependent enzyme [Eubacteriales bacterium]